MLRTSKLDMAETVKASDIDVFLSDASWALHSTYHTVLKASPGASIFGRDMLFDIPFIADLQNIGEHRQRLANLNNPRVNEGRIDYDYKVGQKVLFPGGINALANYIRSHKWNNHGSTWKQNR
jgi:hypothetical protein